MKLHMNTTVVDGMTLSGLAMLIERIVVEKVGAAYFLESAHSRLVWKKILLHRS